MRPRWSALFFCFIKDTADYIGAFLFLGLIQMRIDIRRCGQIRMTEEGRYIQQRHILIDEDAGEGMAQIVKPNLAQSITPDAMLLAMILEVRANFCRTFTIIGFLSILIMIFITIEEPVGYAQTIFLKIAKMA